MIRADLPATLTAADDGTITGVAVPYNTFGRTSSGPVAFAPGSLRLSRDTLPLILDHDVTQPIGVVTALADEDDRAVFTAVLDDTTTAATARAQMRSRSRAGISVGVEPTTTEDTDDGIVVTAAELLELSSVVIPAYQEATVLAAAKKTNPEPEKEEDPPVTETVAEPGGHPAPATPPPPVASIAPARTVQALAAHITDRVRANRDSDSRDVARIIAAAEQAALRAALSDITTTQVPPAPTYLSDLDNYVEFGMPTVQALTVQTVNSWPVKQRQIKTWPTVGKQTPGEKSEIPSTAVAMEWADITDATYAFGVDVSLQVIEDSGEQVLTDIFQMTSEAVANAINTDALAALDAAATAGGTGFGDLSAIGAAVATVLGTGRGSPVILAAPDVWGSLWELTAAGGPALSRLTGVDDQIPVVPDNMINAGTAYVASRRAFKTYISAESRLRAVEVSLLGLNIGLYRRAGFRVVDGNAIVKITSA